MQYNAALHHPRQRIHPRHHRHTGVQLQKLREEFEKVDTDHNGVLSIEELGVAIENVRDPACHPHENP